MQTAIKTVASVWRESKRAYLSLNIICSEMRRVFQERSSIQTVSFGEQVMPKNKDPIIILCEIEAITIIILQIFCSL